MTEKFGGELWRRRIRTFFSVIDFDGDGQLTEKDCDEVADRYVELGKLDAVSAKRVRRKLTDLFREFLGTSTNASPISSDDLVNVFEKAGLDKLAQACVKFFGLLFDLIDVNGDGVVGREEYQLFAKVLKLEPENADISFNAVDADGDGRISYDEFINATIEYTTPIVGTTDLFWGKLVD